jgi:predicted esterase
MRRDGNDFAAATAAVMDAYGRHAFAACLELAVDTRDRFPEHRARATHWIACVRSLIGEPHIALDELETGLDRGLWWAEDMLRADPDLEAARRLPAFERTVSRSAVSFAEQRPSARPPLIELPDGRPRGLVVALHGVSGTAEETLPHWRGCAAARCVVVAPESPYRATSDDQETGRSWPSVDASARIVADALAASGVFPEGMPRVVGGFSQGGRIATQLAIGGLPIPWSGAIVIAPASRGAEGITHPASTDRPRFSIVVGRDDVAFLDRALELRDELETAGVAVRLETAPGVAHGYPPGSEAYLDRALAFVLA